MDILSQYLEQRQIIENKLIDQKDLLFIKQNRLLVEVLSDEIVSLDFAIAEMRKAFSDKLGYRPRRDNLLTRADFYLSL